MECFELKENFRIGPWLVEPQRLTLSRNGESLTVKPRSMAVLVELARGRGDVIGRQELMNRVWGEADVTDDVLTQCVVELRRALGDHARHPEYIETIKRVGFRLIPIPEKVGEADVRGARRIRRAAMSLVVLAVLALAAIGWRFARPVPPIEDFSVAVLPFANYGSDEGHFADGVAEELLDSLAQIPNLRVPARTSSFAFRDRHMDVAEIGQQLRVAHLVEGSVRRSGNRIRVTAQLIDVDDGYHRWSRTYEYELDEVFVVQRQIAQDVAEALAVSLGATTDKLTTTDPRAYDLYLAGRHHWRLGHIERARELFEQAVAADPDYALAHAALAALLTFFQENPGGVRQSGQDHPVQLGRAKAAAGIALKLAPARAEVHIALASIAALEKDAAAEQAALERAISLNPASVEAYVRLSRLLAARGRYDLALAHLGTAAELDPLNPEVAVSHASLLALFEGYDAAVARLERLIDLDLASPRLWDALMDLAADFGRYVDRVRYGIESVNASPDEAWPKAQLGDAFTELGELELADRWITAAERISPIEALKARARWHGASGDFESLARVVSVALPPDGSASSMAMTPAQSASTGITALAELNTGNPERTVKLIRRMIAASPTLWRRQPHVSIYSMIVLARALQASGDEKGMRQALEDARGLLNEAKRAGIEGYPWLTVISASVHQLSGQADRASRAFSDAVEQGWRAWTLEQYSVAQPLAREEETVRRIELDLERMREMVQREGLAVPPSGPPVRQAGS